MTSTHRSYKYKIKRNSKYFDILMGISIKSKNLYNEVLYRQRQNYFNFTKNTKDNGTDENLHLDKFFLRGFPLVTECTKSDSYKALIGLAQTATSIVLKVSDDLTSFTQATKSYYKDKSLFTGRPKLPTYKKNMSNFSFTNQQCKIKGDFISFPKVLNGLLLPLPKIKSNLKLHKLSEVRVIFKGNYFIIEVVLDLDIFTKNTNLTRHILGIDLGVDNFATIVTTLDNEKPIIINGKGLKSYNQFFNKCIAKEKSYLTKRYNKYKSKHMDSMYTERNNKLHDFMHKASTYIINYALENKIGNIVIGYNKGWKQNIDLGRKVNQKFVSIPYYKFIQLLTYKCEESGILLHITEEGYTSGTSFMDNEIPIKDNYDNSRRIQRGLFKTNTKLIVNADVNASYQIIKKVFPNVCNTGGIVVERLQPKRLTICNFR